MKQDTGLLGEEGMQEAGRGSYVEVVMPVRQTSRVKQAMEIKVQGTETNGDSTRNRCCLLYSFKDFKALMLGLHNSSNSLLYKMWFLGSENSSTIFWQLVRNAESDWGQSTCPACDFDRHHKEEEGSRRQRGGGGEKKKEG